MRLTLVTAPTRAPIDLSTVRQHCRVDHRDDDLTLQSLLAGAVSYLDGPSGVLGRAIMPQTWALELDAWPGELMLPVEPVRSVVVTYSDADGVTQTLPASSYTLSDWPSMATRWHFLPDAVRPVLADVPYPVKITMEAGAASAQGVDESLKIAMLMLVGHWYENREAVTVGTTATELPLAVDTLLARHRRML